MNGVVEVEVFGAFGIVERIKRRESEMKKERGRKHGIGMVKKDEAERTKKGGRKAVGTTRLPIPQLA